MRVCFEPIGEEIECAAEETVLEAAFHHGYNLVYGCREGQCSACKCFLLEGNVALKPYSSFALSDTERSNGYSLMCRAMPEQDLVVELLHYDPDSYRLEHPIRDHEATVEAVEPLTHDIVQVLLRTPQFSFTPGQYVDLHVPGAPGVKRSFSMANLPGDGHVELIIKRYPGGRLSGLLDGRIAPGLSMRFTGPYGSLRLRCSQRPILMIAGGSGMAPILSILRQLAAESCERPVRFFYGARAERDLFYLEEIARLGARLADFRFTPVTGRLVHEAVDDYLTSDEISRPDAYLCGPPPMIEAAEQMLVGKHELEDGRIFSDKFTTAADAEPVQRVASDETEREFSWFEPCARRATLYEDVTIDTQPSVHRHLRRGWPVRFEDGRGTWDDASTAVCSSDWFAFRDPGEQWERPFYQSGAAMERQIERTVRSAVGEGLMSDFAPEWVELLRSYLLVSAYVEHGLWFAMATVARDCLSDSVSTCVCLQAAMKQRSAQAIVLYAMDLEEHFGPFPLEAARQAFLADEEWQPTRRYLERLAATRDWCEVIVAANLCFEPVVGTLLRRELGTRAAAANGDAVTPVLAASATQEWEWARVWTVALVRFLLADSRHGPGNRRLVGGWVGDWLAQANDVALALVPLAKRASVDIDVDQALGRVRAYAGQLLESVESPESAGHWAASRRRRIRPARARPDAKDSHDFVGLVMARSAEGDAVAEILERLDGVRVVEQPSFWEIRAKDRLAIQYADISDQLGYEIDGYAIQREMATHYGRMVVTDEALMLFSDPTQAMQHLMS